MEDSGPSLKGLEDVVCRFVMLKPKDTMSYVYCTEIRNRGLIFKKG